MSLTLHNSVSIRKSARTFQTRLDKINTYTLIGANLLAAYLLVEQNIHFSQLLVLYIAQSLVIILLNVFRILLLKECFTTGSRWYSKPLEPSRSTKIKAAISMLTTMLTVQAVYAFFVGMFAIDTSVAQPSDIIYLQMLHSIEWGWIVAALPLFAIHHVVSFIPEITQLRKLKGKNAPDIREIANLPTRRILPMHAMIIGVMLVASFSNSAAVFLIVAVKTFVDVYLHLKRTGHA